MTTTIKAGFGKGTICFPEDMFPVEGFCGVHDDPHMRLMLLRLKDTAFALLEAELVIIPRTSIQGWREKISWVTAAISWTIAFSAKTGPCCPV